MKIPGRSSTTTIIGAMRVLAREIESGDGVANTAIAEAARRMEEMKRVLEYVKSSLVEMGWRVLPNQIDEILNEEDEEANDDGE